MKKVVELVVNREALESMVKKSTVIEILANGYTVPAIKRTTTTNDDNSTDVQETTTNTRVTVKMLGLDEKAIRNARSSIVDGFTSSVKAMCDVFGISCTDEQADAAMQLLNKQFRMSCNQKIGVSGVVFRDKVLTLDAILPVILRIYRNDFKVEQWTSKADYKAATKTPTPFMKWAPIKPAKPKSEKHTGPVEVVKDGAKA